MTKKYDVTVIGGGPSGLMAAITAAEEGAQVLLIDKGNKLGRKLAISGGGRCNVTNRMTVDDLIKHIPGNGRFLHSAFSRFDNEDIIAFFERLGIELKEEDNGRMFPKTDQASSVVQALLSRLKALHVTIKTNAPVDHINYDNDAVKTITLKNGETIETTAVIIAVGGKSVPHTGSTGDGYTWAKDAGHTITTLYPTEVPITSQEAFIRDKVLQGLSLRDVNLSVLNKKGKTIVTHRWDLIFTHFGISGPAVLRCSQFVVKESMKRHYPVQMQIDLFPDQSKQAISNKLEKMAKDDANKAIKNVWKSEIPERYLHFLLERIDLSPNTTYHHLSKQKLTEFVEQLKAFTFDVHGTLSIEKAFVTGGGVSTKEIDPKRMASKLVHGLYFCGEILDIHGYTGGFNITAAFVTGHTAGEAAAIEARHHPFA